MKNQELHALTGGVISGVTGNKDGYIAISIKKDGIDFLLWILSDEEGTRPGHYAIQQRAIKIKTSGD